LHFGNGRLELSFRHFIERRYSRPTQRQLGSLPFNLITLGLISLLITAVLLSITDALTDHLTIDDFFWTTIWAAIILAIAAVVVELILQLIFWREPVVAA